MAPLHLRRAGFGALLPLAAAAAAAAASRAAPPAGFELHPNTSACAELHDNRGTKDPWGQSGPALKFLGEAESLAACNTAAAGWANASAPAERCLSTCWWRAPANATYQNQCYCRVTPTWMPLASAKADSAVINWPCEGPADCSFNGKCSEDVSGGGSGGGGGCACQPAWGGVRCGELQLLPVDASRPGFRQVDSTTGENTSTWGAPLLWDEVSQLWHGWASEMEHGCGINAWETNSQIVHITADSPSGPFTRKDVFAPPFAHEPDVVRGPAGEWVMTYSAYNADTRALGLRGYNASTLAEAACTNCSNGASPPPGGPGCPFQRGQPARLGHPMIQMLAVAAAPAGPWRQVELHGLTAGWDWNTALTIDPDGSAVGLIRGGMSWHATNYSDNTTWHAVGTDATGTPGSEGPQWPTAVEDPYIWRDPRSGVLHALAHAFTPFYGVHAYVKPEDVPANWSDPTATLKWTLGGVAYGNVVNYTAASKRGSFTLVQALRTGHSLHG
eukprot:SAG22_NODE_2657_length_2331_cov_1.494624_2_plen_502_part_00